MTKKQPDEEPAGEALQVYKGDDYAIAKPGGSALMTTAFESGDIGPFNLNRIKVPSGGVTVWSIPSLDGEENPREIECVVPWVRGRQRAWWRVSMDEGGGGGPPDCSSADGLKGHGNNSADPETAVAAHDCEECPWGQWGSDRRGGKGKDCKDMAQMFMLREGSHVPSLLVIPPTSLKPLTDFTMQLLERGKAINHVVVKLSLVKQQSATGVDYAQMVFGYGGDLSPDGVAELNKVRDTLMQVVARKPISVSASDLS